MSASESEDNVVEEEEPCKWLTYPREFRYEIGRHFAEIERHEQWVLLHRSGLIFPCECDFLIVFQKTGKIYAQSDSLLDIKKYWQAIRGGVDPSKPMCCKIRAIEPIYTPTSRYHRKFAWQNAWHSLVCAKDPRLGRQSPLSSLPDECISRIAALSNPLIKEEADYGKVGISRHGYNRVALDIGTYTTMFGPIGEEVPSVIPTRIANSLWSPYGVAGKTLQADPIAMMNALTPIDNGVPSDWDLYEKFVAHLLYEELQVPQACSILLTSPPDISEKYFSKLPEIYFEKFGILDIYVSKQQWLAAAAVGRPTCVVVDSSFTRTTVTAGDCEFSRCYDFAPFGGDSVTRSLVSILCKSGVLMDSASCYSWANDLKHRAAYVDDGRRTPSSSFALPDGKQVMLGDELSLCTAHMFEGNKLSDLVQSVTQRYTSSGYSNTLEPVIVMCGGNCLLPGFQEKMACNFPKHEIICPTNCDTLPWLGASILGELSTFQSMWVYSQDYSERGPDVLRRACGC
ncbi:actin 4 [Pelomyxa schiedti]|nr:actin 4 [Pelomyxa schiedti]